MRTKRLFLTALCAIVCFVGYARTNIPLSTEFPGGRGGARAPVPTPTAFLDETTLLFDFPEVAESQVVLISQETNQIVYADNYESSTQVQINLTNEGLSCGSYWIHLSVFGYWWWGQFVLEEYDENRMATPLFSADVENVVSMYSDENAEIFYLHTMIGKHTGPGMKYTVTREGEILSEEPSLQMWACWDNGIMYTHEICQKAFLNQYGDTVVNVYDVRPGYCSQHFYLAQPMFCRDGELFVWYGAIRKGIYSKIYSYKAGGVEEERVEQNYFWATGLEMFDDNVICTGYVADDGLFKKDDGLFTMYHNVDKSIKWEKQTPKKLGIKCPTGLSLVGDTFYIWSDKDHTMYTVPKSFFVGAAEAGMTDLQTPIANSESSEQYYDLQGRPVDGTQKGILIRNGKKVIVK